MTTSEALNKFNRLIAAGKFDSYLDSIVLAINHRRGAIREERLTLFAEGDRIRITNCRPKYLVGYTGTIVQMNPRAKHPITVDLDVPRVRRYSGIGLRLNAAMIERIDSTP